MKTDQPLEAEAGFLQTVSDALAHLKLKLQHDYEQAYPNLREIIHLVLDEEETKARDLSLFPHLLFPDLVEAHLANLNLKPVETIHDELLAPHRFNGKTHQPAFAALCG
jgi:hypothetical protein